MKSYFHGVESAFSGVDNWTFKFSLCKTALYCGRGEKSIQKWDKITTYGEKIYHDAISIAFLLPMEMHPKDPQMICIGMQPFVSKYINYKPRCLGPIERLRVQKMEPSHWRGVVTHACPFKSNLHSRFQLNNLNSSQKLQGLNGTLMGPMWNVYDNLLVKNLSYHLMIDLLPFPSPIQWRFKHCSIQKYLSLCYSCNFIWYHSPLYISLWAWPNKEIGRKKV